MVVAPVEGALVEDVALQVLRDADLFNFKQPIVFDLQIRRLDHFGRVTDKDLQGAGMSIAEIRRLRASVADMQKKMRSRHTEPDNVYVKNECIESTPKIDPNKTVITKEQIKLMELIGEGTFAVVKRALWMQPNGQKVDVAVKILRDVSPIVMEDLQIEASHLLKLHHPNLIRMYGVVQSPAMLVFELCEGGSLLDRLRDDKKPVPLISVLLDYCLQLVKALAFLEAKHCVHRDVAARNILLSKDEKFLKLSDFGLMRNLKENEEMYIMSAQKRVPFSWCPPESLRHRKFSHASDVWAFGVTVWEMFTLGEEPWVGCRAKEVLDRISAGERLEKPEYCSQRIYDIIQLCWKLNPDHRPKFNLLRGFLKEAEFNVAEVRDAHSDNGEKSLQIAVGDKLIVIENTGLVWQGQNERTRRFGTFPRSSVFVHGKGAQTPVAVSTPAKENRPPATGGNSRISMPIKGSFIHAGHGDVLGGPSWGTSEGIDPIYLKNPVLGMPMEFRTTGMPDIIPSIVEYNKTRSGSQSKPELPARQPVVRSSIPPLSFDPEWDDDPFDEAEQEGFTPSDIWMPMPSTSHAPPVVPVQPLSYDEVPLENRAAGYPQPNSNVRSHPTTTSTTTSSSASTGKPPTVDWANTSQSQWGKPGTTTGSGMLIFPTSTGSGSVVIPAAPNTSHSSKSGISQNQNISSSAPFWQPTNMYNTNMNTNGGSNVLGHGTTRPPVNISSVPRPITTQSDIRWGHNQTPPPINAAGYSQQSNNQIRPSTTTSSSSGFEMARQSIAAGLIPGKEPITAMPSNSHTAPTVQPATQTIAALPKPTNDVLNELNQKVRSGSVKLRPSTTTTTAAAPPVLMMTETGLTLAGPDPFVISHDARNALQKDRYNEIVERRITQNPPNLSTSFQHPSTSAAASQIRPHSSMGTIPTGSAPRPTGPPASSIGCLIPTQLPIPTKPQHQQQQQQQPPSLPTNVPTITRPPAQPVHQSVTQQQPSRPPLSVNTNQQYPAPPSHSQSASISQPPTGAPPRPPSASALPATASVAPPRPQTAAPSTTSTTAPKANLPQPGASATSSSVSTRSVPSVSSAPNLTAQPDRRSKIEEEVRTLLPAPSALLLGSHSATTSPIPQISQPATIPPPTAASTATVVPPPSAGPPPPYAPSATSAAPPLPSTAPPSHTRNTSNPTPEPVVLSLRTVLEPTRLPVSYPSIPSSSSSSNVVGSSSSLLSEQDKKGLSSSEVAKMESDYAAAIRLSLLQPQPSGPVYPSLGYGGSSSMNPLYPGSYGSQMPLFDMSNNGQRGFAFGGGMGGYGQSYQYNGYNGGMTSSYGMQQQPYSSSYGGGGSYNHSIGYQPQGYQGGMDYNRSIIGDNYPQTSYPTAPPPSMPIVQQQPPPRPPPAHSASSTSSNDSALSMTQQMEILYKEADFITDRSRCDLMVSRCGGNIADALQKLKMEYLMEIGLASDQMRARSALERNGWDLNAAASQLVS